MEGKGDSLHVSPNHPEISGITITDHEEDLDYVEGTVKRRRGHLTWIWNDRWLVLKGVAGTLEYFAKETESKPRKTLQLLETTEVEVSESKRKSGAANGGTMFMIKVEVDKKNQFEFAVPTEQEARRWEEGIKKSARAAGDRQRRTSLVTRPTFGKIPRQVDRMFQEQESPKKLRPTPVLSNLAVHSVKDGLTIYRELNTDDSSSNPEQCRIVYDSEAKRKNVIICCLVGCIGLLILGPVLEIFCSKSLYCLIVFTVWVGAVIAAHRFVQRTRTRSLGLLANKAMRGNPSEIMQALLSGDLIDVGLSPLSNATVLEQKDSHTDILHVRQRPVWIWPFWMKPRDMVLMRYWCADGTGNAAIYLSSVEHEAAPPSSQFVRAHLTEGGYFISPAKSKTGLERSLVTMVVRYNPGIAWASFLRELLVDFHTLMAMPMLFGLHTLAEHMESRDFENPILKEGDTLREESVKTHRRTTSIKVPMQPSQIVEIPRIESSVPSEMWSDPSTDKFMVRGPTYLQDKVKVRAKQSEFQLVAFEAFIVEDSSDLYHISQRNDTAINKALDAATDFSMVISLILTPKSMISMCFQPKTADWRENRNPFTDLLLDFIDGDDEFRSTRFKLIPHLVEGPFLLRHLLTPRPVIMGNKGLDVKYYREPRYLEVDIDVTSDRAARSVTGLVLPITKRVVLDIAFLVEAQSTEELPEAVIGAFRVNRVDLSKGMKIPKNTRPAPPEASSSPEKPTKSNLLSPPRASMRKASEPVEL